MWALVSSLQVMSYLSLVKLNYPANFLLFLDYLSSVHNYNSLLPNYFEKIPDKEDQKIPVFNEQFEERGINNQVMLLLCGGDLEMLIVSIVVLFIFDSLLAKTK